MAVLLSLHKSIFTLLARNRPVYCKVRYERGADVSFEHPTVHSTFTLTLGLDNKIIINSEKGTGLKK